jgi:hypothetical protein
MGVAGLWYDLATAARRRASFERYSPSEIGTIN